VHYGVWCVYYGVRSAHKGCIVIGVYSDVCIVMAECARQLVLEPYLALLNDVRSSSHYVWSLKISFNSFFVAYLISCHCVSCCVYHRAFV